MSSIGIEFLIMLTAAAAPDCGALERQASEQGTYIPGHLAIHEVVGEGRAQFYSAPDPGCAMAGVFIIPRDQVIAYVEYGGYTSVMYLKKGGGEALGWVRSDRLRATGTGISPE